MDQQQSVPMPPWLFVFAGMGLAVFGVYALLLNISSGAISWIGIVASVTLISTAIPITIWARRSKSPR